MIFSRNDEILTKPATVTNCWEVYCNEIVMIA